MSGSNDALTQFMLMQARQQRQPSTQARLAQQMMAQNAAMANQPSYGAGPAIARVGSNVLAGLMSGMAERSDREREQETEQRFLDRQDKQRHLWDQELTAGPPGQRPPPQQPPADMPQGAPTASGTTADMPGPTVTAAAPADPMARLQWLAGLAGRGNRAAETQLVIEREAFNRSENQRVRQEDREFQARLAAANRAPRAPEQLIPTMGADGNPVLTPLSRAAGQQPWRPPERPQSEELVQVVTPEGPRLLPRSQAAGMEPYRAAASAPTRLSASEMERREQTENELAGAQNARQALQRALDLSPQAYAGWLAETRGTTAGITGIDPRSAEATTRFASTMTEQALQQLRAIFGGNPTEGERNVLQRMQAAPGMSRVERESLIRDALAMVDARETRSRTRLESIVSGNYGVIQPGFTAPRPEPLRDARGDVPAAQPTVPRPGNGGVIDRSRAQNGVPPQGDRPPLSSFGR